MELIKINGTKEINGKSVKVVEGGFGENQKCILASDIALQHDLRLDKINTLINNNINRFNNNDLKDFLKPSEGLRDFAKENGLITNNRTKNIFLLSERGYTKLVAMMDNSNDKKWEVMDSIIEEYFRMREIIQQQQYKLPTNFKEALLMLVEAEEEKEKLLLENETISIEKRLLSGEVFSWANRNLINALVRRYAKGDFGSAWTEYKKNLLYSHSININSRITNYLNKTGKRTKPKTLDMLDDSEIPNAIATIISMCNEENIDISDVIKHYKDGVNLAS